jgi:CRP-like cAMP-binding protein
MTKSMKELLGEHPFLEGFTNKDLEILSGFAADASFETGRQIFREGEEANKFYLVRHGKVAIETYTPGSGNLCIQTIGEGEVLGWSWLVPPYQWNFDARAIELTRAIEIDGECLRQHCEEDKSFGYEISKRFVQIMVQRIQATRMQLLDMYGANK